MSKIDIGTVIDLNDLLESRMLIQANSGGGKSGIARVIMEECVGKLPFIVLDKKGEYYTLKEKFNDILVIGGRNGDIPISMQAASKLAKFIITHQLTVVVDMIEMESDDQRSIFIKDFLKGMMNLPDQYWSPYLVFLEEAHVFCGQQEKTPSAKYVKSLMSEGRKMGFCGILITQRISKLHKDAAAECNNKFIGRTFLDLDINRSASEMGLVGQDKFKLRDLKPQHFWAFGTSIVPHHVHEVKIKNAQTKFPKAGVKINLTNRKPTEKIKKALAKLNELPQEAIKELNDIKSLQLENKRLTIELKKKPAPVVAPQDNNLKQENANLKHLLQQEKNCYAALEKMVGSRNVQWSKAVKMLTEIPGIEIPERKPVAAIAVKSVSFNDGKLSLPKDSAVATILQHHPQNKDATPLMSKNSGAMRMLKAAAMFHPNGISRTRMGAFARMSHTSGSFGTYISSLRQQGYIIGGPDKFMITNEGLQAAGDVDPLPTDPQELINLWCGIIGESNGTARILRILGQNYPNEMTKEELGAEANMTHTSGSFGTYLSYLRSRGLIKTSGQTVIASEELFL